MRISILTLFPGIVEPYFRESLMVRAVERGLIEFEIVDIRDFARDRHRSCDDYPYGGGPGMIMKPEPLSEALVSTVDGACDATVVFPTPSGIRFDRTVAHALSKRAHLVLIAGRYEGVDQRVIDRYVDMELSIGDFVMSSGELASLVVVDTIARLLEGFIRSESLSQESFEDGLLEYPQYTRPECFDGARVPSVLLNGHHAEIERWRRMKRIEKTVAMRPDMLSAQFRRKSTALSFQQLRAVAKAKGRQ